MASALLLMFDTAIITRFTACVKGDFEAGRRTFFVGGTSFKEFPTKNVHTKLSFVSVLGSEAARAE